jgi:hypothetical protein
MHEVEQLIITTPVKKYLALQDMKADISLTCLQNSIARSYLEADESVTDHHISLSLQSVLP